MTLVQRTQVEEESCVKAAPPFWGKPKFTSLLRSYARECRRVEDSAWELFEQADVETAGIWALQLLGKLVGQPKHGLNTSQYRRAIKARALANRSQGTLADIFAVLNAILTPIEYSVIETGVANIDISALAALDDDDVDVVQEVLPFARAGGVSINFYYADTDDVGVWGVSDWGTPTEWGTVVSI